MKVKCEVLVDTESGEFEVTFHNESNPDEPIEYNALRSILFKIFSNTDAQIESTGIESTDKVQKSIH